MTEMILTKSNKADREIEIEKPEILCLSSVSALVEAMGEDAVVKTILAQLTVSFRSHIRTKLEAKTDDDFTYSDADIREMDFSDWKPEARVRKTAAEKAMDMLGKLTPEQAKALLAEYAD